MSAVDLLEPILTGVQQNNYFNGRLLSAEDLRAEQEAQRQKYAQLGTAIGDGVANGLSVSVLRTGPDKPQVRVTAGLAINSYGDLLYLSEDADVTLVPAKQQAEAANGLFAVCENAPALTAMSGDGAYVLVIAPTSGYEGSALVSDPNTTAAGRGSCGARFTVEGVRFRLVKIELDLLEGSTGALRSRIKPLLPPANDAARERLRNLLAHACYGTDELPPYFADPLKKTTDNKPFWSGWGLLDAMRKRGDLTRCHVPLAVVVLTGDGISFVDVWAARRKLIDAAAIDAWRAAASPRRLMEGEAAFLQFQSQLDAVRTLASTSSMAASTYFDALPAAGWLPAGFTWKTFLGAHAPPAITPVDAALLRGIIERSWFEDGFVLSTTPPVPLHVFQVPGQQFVVFARSRNGNIRVTLAPAPTTNETASVTATAPDGAATNSTERNGGVLRVVDLPPAGSYNVTITAPEYLPVTAAQVDVVGGRTTDVSFTLTPLPNGSILVTPKDKQTSENMGKKVSSVRAVAGSRTYNGVMQSDGTWLIADVVDGSYALEGVATGYSVGQGSVSAVPRNKQTSAVLLFQPDVRKDRPSRCISTVAKEPPLGKIRMCMVLKATEFKENYFFLGEESRSTENYVKYNRKFSTEKRAAARKQQKGNRYAANSGEMIYRDEPWTDMVPLKPVTADVQKWLLEWREWFADELNDKGIGKVDPIIYIDPKYRPPRAPLQVRETPPAYAVFGEFAVPLSILLDDEITRAPVDVDDMDMRGIPKDTIRRLKEEDILTVNDLGGAWGELILDITGQPVINPVRQLILDADKAAIKINEDRAYIAGMDEETKGKLDTLGLKDDVALANADLKTLGDALGSESFAMRLIGQARSIVPEASWSLESLGLSGEQTRLLTDRGIDSMGALTTRAGDAEVKTAVGDVMGIAANAIDATLTTMTHDALSTMAEYSVALAPVTSIVSMENIDMTTATRLNEAGFTSAEELAGKTAEEVAAAANISVAAATSVIKEAQDVSVGSLSIGMIAGVSASDETALTQKLGESATIGTVMNLANTELAEPLGTTERADALLTGITAGMQSRMGLIGMQ